MEKWKQAVSKEYFYLLYQLLEDHPWILDKQKALENLWSFCSTNEKKDLMLDLLKRFHFVESEEYKKLEQSIYDYIINEWKLDLAKTSFFPISDGKKPDGSVWATYNFRQHFLKYFNKVPFYDRITQAWGCKQKENIVLIDDFLGSGNKLKSKIKYIKKIKPRNHIYCVCPMGLKYGVDNLSQEFPDVNFYIPLVMNKAISDYYSGEKVTKNKKYIKEITENMQIKKHKDYLGYKQSEALCAYKDYNNIPNNVFPIFWGENTGNLETMFTRNK